MSTHDFIEQSKQKLLERATQEQHEADLCSFKLPVAMDLKTLMCMVANIQLALRHPKNTGLSARICRSLLAQIIERVKREGFPANAEVMLLGLDPDYDEPV